MVSSSSHVSLPKQGTKANSLGGRTHRVEACTCSLPGVLNSATITACSSSDSTTTSTVADSVAFNTARFHTNTFRKFAATTLCTAPSISSVGQPYSANTVRTPLSSQSSASFSLSPFLIVKYVSGSPATCVVSTPSKFRDRFLATVGTTSTSTFQAPASFESGRIFRSTFDVRKRVCKRNACRNSLPRLGASRSNSFNFLDVLLNSRLRATLKAQGIALCVESCGCCLLHV